MNSIVSKFHRPSPVAVIGRGIFLSLFLLLTVHGSMLTAQAQRRDHLTEAEVELVRDAQQVDWRMQIFIKAIDRRLLVLKNETATNAKQIEKDSERWGELPTGTRAQLLNDIEKILEESISKVDDVAAHDIKSKLLPVAVNFLADGANRFVPELKLQLAQTTDEKERGAILGALEYCQQIIEASAKVPKLSPKEIKKIQKENEKAQQSN